MLNFKMLVINDHVIKSEASDAGTYQRNINDTLLVGENGTTYQPTKSGYYYCEVTNLYNGTTASKISRFFAVADA